MAGVGGETYHAILVELKERKAGDRD